MLGASWGLPKTFLQLHRGIRVIFREPPTLCFLEQCQYWMFGKPPSLSGSPRQLLEQEAPIISLGSPQHFVFESSVNIGCFREPLPFLLVHKSQKFCFQGAPNNYWNRKPSSILQGAPNVLQLRLLLLFDFRKPPSFLQGAPNILYLKVVSVLDFREPPPFLQAHKSQKFCFQGAPNNCQNSIHVGSLGSPQSSTSCCGYVGSPRHLLLSQFENRKTQSFCLLCRKPPIWGLPGGSLVGRL